MWINMEDRIMEYTSVIKYEKIFDDSKEAISFNKLDKIIKLLQKIRFLL